MMRKKLIVGVIASGVVAFGSVALARSVQEDVAIKRFCAEDWDGGNNADDPAEMARCYKVFKEQDGRFEKINPETPDEKEVLRWCTDLWDEGKHSDDLAAMTWCYKDSKNSLDDGWVIKALGVLTKTCQVRRLAGFQLWCEWRSPD